MTSKWCNSKVFGKDCQLELMFFENEDRVRWKDLFENWMTLKLGMREYRSREPNLLEGLSESAFCIATGTQRLLSLKGGVSSSFDTFNLETEKAHQIKATSIEDDLTSFGPKSVWDELYFLDFYNDGELDGVFDIYLIPNTLIYNFQVNKNQKFSDQQKEGKRPRMHVKKDILLEKDIKPYMKNVEIF